MIKLMPIIEEIHQKQLEEAGVKDIALGAAMAASSFFGGAKAQSKIPTDKPAITQVSVTQISDQEKANWNAFQEWLESKGYSDNSKMDNNKFREGVLQQYKNETGISAPDTNFVKKLQQYQIDSRNDIIQNVEKGNATLSTYDWKGKGWENFQPEVLSMEKRGGPDGKIGKETSKYKFRVWKDSKTGKLTTKFTKPGELASLK